MCISKMLLTLRSTPVFLCSLLEKMIAIELILILAKENSSSQTEAHIEVLSCTLLTIYSIRFFVILLLK